MTPFVYTKIIDQSALSESKKEEKKKEEENTLSLRNFHAVGSGVHFQSSV
jgi:hypothetical protein